MRTIGRESLGRLTQRGIGATIAGGGFWAVMAAIEMFAQMSVRAFGALFILGGLIVYPIGYVISRMLGGDLIARGHVLGGMVRTLAATEGLGWVVVIVVWVQAPQLVPFSVAALLGAHFLPFAWLYRSGAYAVLGLGAVFSATAVQLVAPVRSAVVIPVLMAVGYSVAAVFVYGRNRRPGSPPSRG